MKQTAKNTADIAEIKQDIHTIKTNHLYHIEKDMNNINQRVEKMDNRIWWVLGILVASTVVSMIGA